LCTKETRQTYGALRVHADLRAAGVHCGRKRVARLLRGAGLVGCHRRGCLGTTQREPAAEAAPDRVQRQFVAHQPNERWTADITAIPTGAGFLYLAVVLDVFSPRIVGWAMATQLRTELVLAALTMALQQRRPAAGVVPSMGSVGDCYDNAITASFFATLECELRARPHFRIQDEARAALFDYIEGFSNRHRRHSALGYTTTAA
jgi:putative transposase